MKESRIDAYKREEQERIDNELIHEMSVRAEAAAVLAEPFELGGAEGVEFEPGCKKDGTIMIFRGIEHLAKLIGVPLNEHIDGTGDKPYYKYSICFQGVKFEQFEITPIKGYPLKGDESNV